MNFARLSNGEVVEIITTESGTDISELFHRDIVASLKECSDGVGVGWIYENGEFSEPAPPSFSDFKSTLKANVDALAETERLKYITSGAGQALTYMQKSDEARRYLSSESPNVADYPLLSAEVGITAPDIAGVATVVSAAYGQWQQIGAAIEAVRLGGKAAIDAAEDDVSAKSAFDAITWPVA